MPYSVAMLGLSSVFNFTYAREHKTHKTRRRQSSSARTQPRNVSSKSTTRAIATRITQHTYRLELPRVLLRELINQRRNHAARSAPRRPEINQHRHVALQHLGIERRIGHHGGERACARETVAYERTPTTIDDGRFVMNRPPRDRRRVRVVVTRARSVSRSRARSNPHVSDAHHRRLRHPPRHDPHSRARIASMIFLPIHRARLARRSRSPRARDRASIASRESRIARIVVSHHPSSRVPDVLVSSARATTTTRAA